MLASTPLQRDWKLISYENSAPQLNNTAEINRKPDEKFPVSFWKFKLIVYFCTHLERWQSGRLRRSWKPLTVTGPGVRIPLSPPDT